MKELIERIMAVQNELGLSVNALAVKCGISPANLHKMLKGQQPITNKTIEKIASIGVNEEWLQTGKGEMLLPRAEQHVHGGTNISQTGDVNVLPSSALDRAFDELAAQRKLTEQALKMLQKRDEQFDRLLSVIERSGAKD